MNNLLKLSTLFLISCQSLPQKKEIFIPATNYRVNQKTLRTNGYYYSEKVREDFCRRVPIPNTIGMMPDQSSRYDQKYISAFVLYSDGYSYHTGGLITSGVDLSSSSDHCDELIAHNTFDRAREKFENRIGQLSTKGYGKKRDKGVFALSQDIIRIQIYSGYETLQLMEYEGVVTNDTTFHLHSRRHYSASRKKHIQKLDDTYHFRMHKTKPDSASFIRDHRDKFPQSRRNRK